MYDKCYFVGSLLVFLFLIQQGESLKCFQCNSHINESCAHELPPDVFVQDCPRDDKQYTLCRKIKQVIDFEVNGLPPDSRIIRSCGWLDGDRDDYCYHRSGFGGRQEVCSCKNDKCNSSAVQYASAVLIGSALLALFKIFK